MSESRYISMTNTIASTLSSSIGFIQLKLSDYDQKEIDFDKIINQRFKTLKHPRMSIKN
jgi:hypothetical protein